MTNRNALFLMLSFALTHEMFAQGIFPYETQLQKWEYVTWNFWGGQCERRMIKNGLKTEICESDYIEIWDCDENEQDCLLKGYYRIEGDSVWVRNVGYWNGVKYVDSVDCSQPSGLAYDFGSELNDTLACALNTSYAPFQKEFWVSDVQLHAYEGIDRITRTLRYRPYPNAPNVIYTMNWIEGIGSDVHPFYPLSCVGDHCEREQQLTRVFSDADLIYQDTLLHFSFPCTGWITSEKSARLENTYLVLSPNPAHASFTIFSPVGDVSGPGLHVAIYDPLGKRVLVKSNHRAHERIGVEGLPAGVYLVRINYNNQYTTSKLVIE